MDIMMLKALFALLPFFVVMPLFSQEHQGPVARFSFNNGTARDEVSGNKAILKGVSPSADRFGNENHAVLLVGHDYSYINLGSYPALKQRNATISMWVKVENEIWAGKGREIDPIIMTRNSTYVTEDFYEAYYMGYDVISKRLTALCTLDSTKQIAMITPQPFERFAWHHLVFSFDDHFSSLYINGKLLHRVEKGFPTTFDPMDSVLVGVTHSWKNNRFFNGSVDDIAFYDRVLTEEEIRELYNSPNPDTRKAMLQKIFYLLLAVLVLAVAYFLLRYIRLQREKKQLQLANKMLETELRINRALMNPHFVFNSMNALQHFILRKENDLANNYLVKFSKLIRKMLESNVSNIISLEMEIDLIRRYLEIEDLRFEGNIRHEIEVAPDLIPSAIYIPVMIIQPFVENAIWHGLLQKPGDKLIRVSFSKQEEKYLLCVIDDNGVGRKVKNSIDLEKKSLATAFVQQRLTLLNKLYNLNCTLVLEDKPEGQGTTVRILLPILNN